MNKKKRKELLKKVGIWTLLIVIIGSMAVSIMAPLLGW